MAGTSAVTALEDDGATLDDTGAATLDDAGADGPDSDDLMAESWVPEISIKRLMASLPEAPASRRSALFSP